MGYITSFLFVFLVIGISTILEKLKLVGIEGSRKIIHIGVCNWWFIAMYFFDKPIKAAIVPACFIVINYISYKKNVFSAMERGEGSEDLGTVYYSISLFLLALWTFYLQKPEIGLLGILVMGYGDGFAALVGKKWGKTPIFLNKKKSVQGSLTVLIFSTIITLAIINYYYTSISLPNGILIGLAIGLLSTVVEAISPNGFDNLSLPLVSSVGFYGVVHYLI
jgi:phytol kinase